MARPSLKKGQCYSKGDRVVRVEKFVKSSDGKRRLLVRNISSGRTFPLLQTALKTWEYVPPEPPSALDLSSTQTATTNTEPLWFHLPPETAVTAASIDPVPPSSPSPKPTRDHWVNHHAFVIVAVAVALMICAALFIWAAHQP